MSELVLLRHGESEWNHARRFTGWSDVPLTARGRAQAQRAGAALAAGGFVPQVCFVSALQRTHTTLEEVLVAYAGLCVPPVHADWRLNERHYGALQGLARGEALARYGARTVYAWQRRWSRRPPPVGTYDPRHPAHAVGHAAYPDFPGAESLADTLARLLPLWEGPIRERLRAGHNVLVVSHGNTLRALVAHLDGLARWRVPALHLPTGRPLRYRFDAALRVRERAYLGQRTGSFGRLWGRMLGVPA